jgi:predicted nucleic-acid-binding protein
MIGLDTNVIVRYIVQDDATQSALATTLIESLSPEQPGYISIITLIELVWVLQGAYQASREDIITTLDSLLKTKEIVISQADIVAQALRIFSHTKADFSDCLIERFGHAALCEYTVSFDKGAIKHTGMKLLGTL